MFHLARRTMVGTMNKGRTARLVAIALVTAGMVVAQPAHAGEQPNWNSNSSMSEKAAAPGSAAATGLRAAPGAPTLAAAEPPPRGLGSATTSDGNRIDIMESADSVVFYRNWIKDIGWSDWNALDAPAAGIWYKPAMTWTPDGKRLDVFVAGNTDFRLYQRTWTAASGWGGWGDLGGTLITSPSAQWTNNGNRIDIFAVGADSRLYQKPWTSSSGWGDWGGFDGPAVGIGSAPSITWTANGKRLDVFVTGLLDEQGHGNRHLHQKFWSASSGWSGWGDLGGGLVSDPSASWTGGGNRIDVFGVGTDLHPFQKFWSASAGWSAWKRFDNPPGGQLGLAPTAGWAANASRLDVFVGIPTGRPFQKTLTPPSTSWSNWIDVG